MAGQQPPLVNLGNTPAHPQSTSALQGKAAAAQAKLDADARRRVFREATAVLCEDIIASATAKDTSSIRILKEFHVFSKIPIELRVKIWNHAINAPRFVEVHQLAGCFTKILPPLLYRVCRESHEEVRQAYGAYHSAETERGITFEPKARWVRLEHDIIHIKPTPAPRYDKPDMAILSAASARLGREWTPIRQYRSDGMPTVDTDRWLTRPELFDRIKTLAISRDLLVHLPDDYECFIRHFFPNLMVLIVLIDEEIDIDEEWGVHDLEYGRYEKPVPTKLRQFENPHSIPRFDLAKKTKGPFKEVKLNIDYRMDIEYEMRKRFTKEEADYLWYTAPRIRVLGACGPKDIPVDVRGRLPYKPKEEKKRELDTNPFGDFISGNSSTISTPGT